MAFAFPPPPVPSECAVIPVPNTTSMNLLTVPRDEGAAEGLWERRVLEVGRNRASREAVRGGGDGRRWWRGQLGPPHETALREELKPCRGTSIIESFFFFSKVMDFVVGLLTNYGFAQIMSEEVEHWTAYLSIYRV